MNHLKLKTLNGKIVILPENSVKYMNRNKINIDIIHNQKERAWLKNKRIYMVGGCELSYIRDYLRTYEMNIYHSFENGTSSDPFAEFHNTLTEFFSIKPNFIILSQTQLIRPLIQKANSSSDDKASNLANEIDIIIEQLQTSIDIINKTYENIPIFVVTYPYFDISINGSNSYKYNDTPRLLLLRYKFLLYNKCKKNINPNLYALDCDIIWLQHNYNDNILRYEVNGSHPERTGALLIGEEFIKNIYGIDTSRNRIKCIVLDCDNTLWDGIIREDKLTDIKLRKRYIEVLYMLSQRGILLCLASKNDPEDLKLIEFIFKTVPAFYRNIVCSKINWNPKSSNIKEIADLLNIGLDTIAFIDDNEFERNEVMTQLPTVHIYNDKQIPDLPYMCEFEPISQNVTDDSLSRVAFYKTEVERHIEEQTAIKQNISYEAFLKTTNLKIIFSQVNEHDIDRVLEIFSKTNQLNATLKRTSRSDIVKYMKESDVKLYKFVMDDKFGSYGIIGGTIIKIHALEKVAYIEEFALSCRGMGRKAELAFLIYIFNQLTKIVDIVRIIVTPAKKNQHLIQTLISTSFQHKEIINETNSLYEASIQSFDISYPEWFTVIE